MALGFELQMPEASQGAGWATAQQPSAQLTEIQGERIVLVTNRAAPPGAPLALTAPDGEIFEARTKGCRRGAHTDEYVLEARLVNLSRAARERLARFTSPPARPTSSRAKGHLER